MRRRELRDSSKAQIGLFETVRGLLDSDKIETHRNTILTLLEKHSDEEDLKLLALLEKVLPIFSDSEEQNIEQKAKDVLDDLNCTNLGGTKTSKRLAHLLTILQEANQRVNKIQEKIQASLKYRLPADYQHPDSYTHLKVNHLKMMTSRRPSLFVTIKDISPLLEYDKGGLFHQLRSKVESIKELTDRCVELKARVLAFWEERDIQAYSKASETVRLFDDQQALKTLLKDYQRAVFKDDELERKLAVIEAAVLALSLFRSPPEIAPARSLISEMKEEMNRDPNFIGSVLLSSHTSTSQADEEEWVANLQELISKEEQRAKEERDGLRGVFAIHNKVSELKFLKKTGPRLVIMNRGIETLRKWYADWAKERLTKVKKDGNKKKPQELAQDDEIERFLYEVKLKPKVITQLLQMCKSLKEKLVAGGVEWKFKQSLSTEKQKLSRNHVFLKKFDLEGVHSASGKILFKQSHLIHSTRTRGYQ